MKPVRMYTNANGSFQVIRAGMKLYQVSSGCDIEIVSISKIYVKILILSNPNKHAFLGKGSYCYVLKENVINNEMYQPII